MYAQAMCADGGAARAAAAAACRFANIPNPAPKAPDASIPTPLASGHSEIALRREGGGFTVPVSVNGAITLAFIIDSGATDVSIPADVVLTLMRTGTIDPGDFLGSRTYVMADGSTAPSPIFRIRSLRVGDREVRNVTASIAPAKGSLLLGQSFLRQFGSWSIDNRRGVLVLD
jgi:clan AA aspartic protease (TIGR02281 family)